MAPVIDLVSAADARRPVARLVSPDAYFEDVPGLTLLAAIPVS